MPCNLTDKRGTGKYQKMKLWHAPEGQCATCPATLSKTEIGKGVRRCHACRKANPGRPTPSTVIVKPRASQPPQKQSWWAESPRDGFTEKALAQSFSGYRQSQPLNHKGFGDGI